MSTGPLSLAIGIKRPVYGFGPAEPRTSGTFKLPWLGWEQSERVRELARGIKDVFDPHGVLNPGKAICLGAETTP